MRAPILCHLLLTACLFGGFGGTAPAVDAANSPESPKAVDYPLTLSPPGIRKIAPMAWDGERAGWIRPAYFEVTAVPPREALVWERSSADGDLEAVGLALMERGFQIDWRMRGDVWHATDTLAEGIAFAFGPMEAWDSETTLRFDPGDMGLADKTNRDGSLNTEAVFLEFRLRGYLVYQETHGDQEAHTIVSDWSDTVQPQFPEDGVPLMEFVNDPKVTAFVRNIQNDFPISVSVVYQDVGGGSPARTVTDEATIREIFDALVHMTVLGEKGSGHTDDYLKYTFSMANGGYAGFDFQQGMLLSEGMGLYEVSGFDRLIKALAPQYGKYAPWLPKK